MRILFALGILSLVAAAATADDKRSFHRARLAATAETWEAAAAVLDKIDEDKLDDIDVIEYVTFSKLCVKTADALGVDRKSDPESPTSVVTNVEWSQLLITLAQKAVDSPVKFADLLRDARKVHKGLKRYEELDAKLVKRYGTK